MASDREASTTELEVSHTIVILSVSWDYVMSFIAAIHLITVKSSYPYLTGRALSCTKNFGSDETVNVLIVAESKPAVSCLHGLH